MKKTELKRKIKQLIKESVQRSIGKIDHLLNSGAMDIDAENPGEYGLAKVCASHLLQDEADNNKPLSHGYSAILNNLRRF